MIGDPFTKSVLVGNLGLQFGGQTYAFTDAASLGLVGGTLYSYGPPSNDLTKPNQYNAQTVTSTLDPFAGYWILALQPCTLLVPQP